MHSSVSLFWVARASRVLAFVVAPITDFPKSANLGAWYCATQVCDRETRSRSTRDGARCPIRLAVPLVFAPSFVSRRKRRRLLHRVKRKLEQVVVSATRFDIPLDQSPASVSVISSRRSRAKTNPARERCASRSAGPFRGADGNGRPVDFRFHARIAKSKTCRCCSTAFRLTRVYPAQ